MSGYELIFLLVLLFAGLGLSTLLFVYAYKTDTTDATTGFGLAGFILALITIMGCGMSFDKMTAAHAPDAQTPKTDSVK